MSKKDRKEIKKISLADVQEEMVKKYPLKAYVTVENGEIGSIILNRECKHPCLDFEEVL